APLDPLTSQRRSCSCRYKLAQLLGGSTGPCGGAFDCANRSGLGEAMGIIDSAKRAAISWMNSPGAVRRRMPDVDPKALEIFTRVRPFTMTTPERVFAVCQAVRYVE